MGAVILLTIVIIPLVLTGWNVFTFLKFLIKKTEKRYNKIIEIISIFVGLGYLRIYADLSNIVFANWDAQLRNMQLHSMVSLDAAPTILALSFIAFLGYAVLRFIPAQKLAPMACALSIAAIYFGMGVCILWCIQTCSDFFLMLFPANCLLLLFKTVYILVYQKNALLQQQEQSSKCTRLTKICNTAANLPWMALVLAIPLLGILIAVLCLFGQEPDSLIKAWTETADWTMSQKIAPPNIQYNEHYLCTVAAGGHKKVVKPIRIGIRHGHCVVVNRQLCIANAFEQVLQEKMPGFHKVIRTVYDSAGYPFARHIHSKYAADLIYLLMKPLEWAFLFVLYTVDVNPENRIAVQYPHAPVPDCLE